MAIEDFHVGSCMCLVILEELGGFLLYNNKSVAGYLVVAEQWYINRGEVTLTSLYVFFFDSLSVASALPRFNPITIKTAVTSPRTSPIRIPLLNPAAIKAVSRSRPNCSQ